MHVLKEKETNKTLLLVIFYIFYCAAIVSTVKIPNNGLSPPEIVHSPIDIKLRCTMKAEPLDLVFLIDSSGSLRDKFEDEVNVIRRIVNHVTIDDSATRVMLIQFSGAQHLQFDFNKFTDRQDILRALDVLRHVSGITRIGDALEFALNKMTSENGMRPSNVQKLIYLISDGRTHDYPKHSEMADLIRQRISNVDIYAFGTGEYVALSELIAITKDPNKIITNEKLEYLESIFNRWKGTEICESKPECVKGTDKPLDLILVIDSSESVSRMFSEQIHFAIERVVKNINIHLDAVRFALITYSGQAYVQFKFDNFKYLNNTAVIDYLNKLRSIKGTTSTHLALHEAYELFTNREGTSGARAGVKKLLIVLTDGHSQRSPRNLAKRLKAEGVDIIAISMTPVPYVDEGELLIITQDPSKVFTPDNMQDFEGEFMKYVGFGCPGVNLGTNPTPRIRGATDVTCGANSLSLTVRTKQPMVGLMYAQLYHDDRQCVQLADGRSRELSIKFLEGTCGLLKIPSMQLDGYSYNITVILQFHPIIVTRADQGLSVSCFHTQPVSEQEIGRSFLKKLSDTQCTYRLHRFSPLQCIALDAKVGEILYHKWECDSPHNYQYLVHDCYVKSETKNFNIIDSDGCEIDPQFLETPDYSKFEVKPRKGDAYAFKEMSVFKFPSDNNVVFQCKISLCDMESGAPCTKSIPPKCLNLNPRRNSRAAPETKSGFSMTMNVETRTLNVLENESIRPPRPIKYCDIRM